MSVETKATGICRFCADAESWLDDHGYDDGGRWVNDDGEKIEAALRDACDGPATSRNLDGPDPCNWTVITGDSEETHPGYVWPDDSGIYLTDAWWDTIAEGRASHGGQVVGPL